MFYYEKIKTMNTILQQFYELVQQKNPLHAKFLDNTLSDINAEETEKFENLVYFYKQYKNNSIEELVDKYLYKIAFTMEEQKYFFENDYKYRYSTFAESEHIYKDSRIMDSYAVGLGLSTYLWRVHREVMHYFCKLLTFNKLTGGRGYLEIGCGHGEYFVTAMQKTNFDSYTAVDISETCVAMTKDYIRHSLPNTTKNYEVIHKDIFEYNPAEKFDVVVMGEVLEHVENPSAFLQKIYQLSEENATIFITTAINAPSPDHIYHFRTLQEVIDLFDKEHFVVIDYIAANTNNFSIEKAEKRKVAIVPAFILKKKIIN
jgi:2-polyprenyl-3-methyl-5-hydroxy-6-metoxy-1,4-benzoquinol methylase